jgi:hypothetical protein
MFIMFWCLAPFLWLMFQGNSKGQFPCAEAKSDCTIFLPGLEKQPVWGNSCRPYLWMETCGGALPWCPGWTVSLGRWLWWFLHLTSWHSPTHTVTAIAVKAKHKILEDAFLHTRISSLLTPTASWEGFYKSALSLKNSLKGLTEPAASSYIHSYSFLQSRYSCRCIKERPRSRMSVLVSVESGHIPHRASMCHHMFWVLHCQPGEPIWALV